MDVDLAKLLLDLRTNVGWSPEDAIELMFALRERFKRTPTHRETDVLTWLTKMLYCVEMNLITPSWKTREGQTALQLICDEEMTDKSVTSYFNDESEKDLEEILREIKEEKLNQINVEILENVKKIVFQVQKALSTKRSTQLTGEAKDLHDVCVAVQKTKGYSPRLTQMVSWSLLAQSTSGRLVQVSTGEGKSCIVAMFAAFRALRGDKVDIMSSSTVLAERDMKEWGKFFGILKITVSCNVNKFDSSILRSCYECSVVYGTVESFAGDWLRHNFERTDIFGQRTFQCAIVDEVDSLMLDRGLHVVYISSNMPALQHLNPLLALIWTTVGQHAKTGVPYGEEVLAAVEVEVRSKLLFTPCQQQLQGRCCVPGFLKELVNAKLKLWIENAFLALELTADHQYVIEGHGAVPVDFDCTGVVENFMEWSDGLHQFIQMKHGMKLTDMNAITNYMSNAGLLKMYKNQIFGMSGTLGGQKETETLQSIYGVKTCRIPTYKRRKLFEKKGIIAPDEETWMRAICSVVSEQVSPNAFRGGRAALVICKTIKTAKAVYHELREVTRKTFYVNNNMDNSAIFKGELQPGQVILATNLAGRGADLKLSAAVNSAGGLFVLQTFLPMNARVEQQAFGRTARQGRPGCAQLIVCRNHLNEAIQQALDLQALISITCSILQQNLLEQRLSLFQENLEGVDIKSIALELLHTSDSEMKVAKLVRDDIVERGLTNYLDTHIPKIEKDAELFCHYLTILDQLYQDSNFTPDPWVLSGLNEAWGLWLLLNDDKKDGRVPTETLKRRLEQDMDTALKKLKVRRSPMANLHHYTQFGNELRKSGQMAASILMYTRAVIEDPCWAAVAYYHRAFASLAQAGERPNVACISRVQGDLRKALSSLSYYCQQVKLTHECVTQQCCPLNSLRFIQHMQMKFKGLQLFKANIQEAIRKLEEVRVMGRGVKVDKKLVLFLFPMEDMLPPFILISMELRAALSKDILKTRQILNNPLCDILVEIESLKSLGLSHVYTVNTVFSLGGFISTLFGKN